MTAFYHAYIKVGDKALALQKAMEVVRASNPKYENPLFWAAFMVVGAEA
jgi:CHAT domain-containing protein